MRLLEKPKLPSEMADELGVSVNQINYALRKLKENELVRRTQIGWCLLHMTIAEVETVFSEVQGKGQLRVERHQQERQKFAGYILLNARLRSEGQQFMDAVSEARKQKSAYDEALCDPLVQFGLELGGRLRL